MADVTLEQHGRLSNMDAEASQPGQIGPCLNSAQLEVVEHRGSPLLVFAAAGTGKTQALTARIASLVVRDGVPPDRILAVTFTRKAAREMRQRAAALCGVPESALCHVGTFHSLCMRLLRRFGRLTPVGSDFTVLDPAQALQVMRSCLEREAAGLQEAPSPEQVYRMIEAWRNKGLEPEHVRTVDHDAQAFSARVYQAYRLECERQRAVDFSDLILRAARVLEEHPDALRECREKLFSHLLVDEFQDTNPAQMRLVELLACPGGSEGEPSALSEDSLMVVGDDYQAIHEWRGATVRNILEFTTTFPRARVVCLEMNYRSVPHILQAAARVISRNERQRHKLLLPTRLVVAPGPSGAVQPIEVRGAKDAWDEARDVAASIKSQLELHGGPHRRPSDFAVLYRVNAQSQVLEQALCEAGVPYTVRGSATFFGRAEVRDCLAYARLMVNPQADADFERVINTPPRGLGKSFLEHVKREASQDGRGLLAAVRGVEQAATAAHKQGKRVQGLRTFLCALDAGGLAGGLAATDPRAALSMCLELAGYLPALRDQVRAGDADAADRLANVDALLQLASRTPAGSGLEHFLDMCAVEQDAEDVGAAAPDEAGGGRVSLMTLHASKGLEFPVVHMVACCEDVLPYFRALKEGKVEEERRLCYVGVTRARDRLILSVPRTRSCMGRTFHTYRSRFLAEMGL